MPRYFYRIESKNTGIAPFQVRADSYDHAAQVAARRLYGRLKGLRAVRVTGDAGQSGYYQGYVPASGGTTLTSHGRNFYVSII